jgi:hypothetical protein
MGLPSIKPPIRILIRTRPDQLTTIHPILDKADTSLIERLCVELCITDTTEIQRLITKTWKEKKLDRVDIICDYGVSTNDEPQVMAYDVTIDGSNLIIKPLPHPQIRWMVNKEVEAWKQLSAQYDGITFPGRTDLRESQRRLDQRRLGNAPLVSVLESSIMKD